MATDSQMTSQVVTIQFTKNDKTIMAHMQVMPNMSGNITPDQKPVTRWLFNMQQIAMENSLPIPEGSASEYYADNEADRDVMADKLLDAVIIGRAKADELTQEVADAYASALQGVSATEDVAPALPVAPPVPPVVS